MITNAEGLQEFDIPDSLATHISSGVCAMMRIGSEEEFIVPCLLAVRDFFDEFVVVYNKTRSKTRELIQAIGLNELHTYDYPFDITFRGELHALTPVNSLHHSAYYYNWCLSKVKNEWVAKWDGDNIALPNFRDTKNIINAGKHDAILNCAWDLTGSDMKMLGRQQKVGYETRIFRKDKNVRYQRTMNGFTQILSKTSSPIQQDSPTFLHLKWAKQNPTMYWPTNWNESCHFREIAERHIPHTRYKGQYPQVLIDYIKLNRDSHALIDLYKNNRDPTKGVEYPSEMQGS